MDGKRVGDLLLVKYAYQAAPLTPHRHEFVDK
jgi:hypothetical protein